MKLLTVQIHPERSPELEDKKIIKRFEKLYDKMPFVNSIEVITGYNGANYININCETNNVRALWSLIKNEFYNDGHIGSMLEDATIVMCESDNGQDDYLLLHHFDKNELLDSI